MNMSPFMQQQIDSNTPRNNQLPPYQLNVQQLNNNYIAQSPNKQITQLTVNELNNPSQNNLNKININFSKDTNMTQPSIIFNNQSNNLLVNNNNNQILLINKPQQNQFDNQNIQPQSSSFNPFQQTADISEAQQQQLYQQQLLSQQYRLPSPPSNIIHSSSPQSNTQQHSTFQASPNALINYQQQDYLQQTKNDYFQLNTDIQPPSMFITPQNIIPDQSANSFLIQQHPHVSTPQSQSISPSPFPPSTSFSLSSQPSPPFSLPQMDNYPTPPDSEVMMEKQQIQMQEYQVNQYNEQNQQNKQQNENEEETQFPEGLMKEDITKDQNQNDNESMPPGLDFDGNGNENENDMPVYKVDEEDNEEEDDDESESDSDEEEKVKEKERIEKQNQKKLDENLNLQKRKPIYINQELDVTPTIPFTPRQSFQSKDKEQEKEDPNKKFVLTQQSSFAFLVPVIPKYKLIKIDEVIQANRQGDVLFSSNQQNNQINERQYKYGQAINILLQMMSDEKERKENEQLDRAREEEENNAMEQEDKKEEKIQKQKNHQNDLGLPPPYSQTDSLQNKFDNSFINYTNKDTEILPEMELRLIIRDGQLRPGLITGFESNSSFSSRNGGMYNNFDSPGRMKNEQQMNRQGVLYNSYSSLNQIHNLQQSQKDSMQTGDWVRSTDNKRRQQYKKGRGDINMSSRGELGSNYSIHSYTPHQALPNRIDNAWKGQRIKQREKKKKMQNEGNTIDGNQSDEEEYESSEEEDEEEEGEGENINNEQERINQENIAEELSQLKDKIEKEREQKKQEEREQKKQERREKERNDFIDGRTRDIQRSLNRLTPEQFDNVISELIQLLVVSWSEMVRKAEERWKDNERNEDNKEKSVQNKQQQQQKEIERQNERELKCKYEAKERERLLMDKLVRMLYEKGVYEEKFARLHADLSAVLTGQLNQIDEQDEIEKDRNKEKYMKLGGNQGGEEEDDEEEEVNERKDEFEEKRNKQTEKRIKEEKRKRMKGMYKRLYKAPQRNVLLKKLLIQCVNNEFNEEREISKQMALKEKEKKSEKEKEKEKQLEKEQQEKQKEEDEDTRLERLKKLKEEQDQEELHKVRVKGNVIFAGELVNCGVINTKEGSKFLSALWEGTTPGSPNEINMEALALFFTSVGELIQQQYKENMEKNMNAIKKVISGGQLSTRIKFKLQDVLDFYKNGWPKRIASNAYQDRQNQQQKEKEQEKAKEREKEIEREKEQETLKRMLSQQNTNKSSTSQFSYSSQQYSTQKQTPTIPSAPGSVLIPKPGPTQSPPTLYIPQQYSSQQQQSYSSPSVQLSNQQQQAQTQVSLNAFQTYSYPQQQKQQIHKSPPPFNTYTPTPQTQQQSQIAQTPILNSSQLTYSGQKNIFRPQPELPSFGRLEANKADNDREKDKYKDSARREYQNKDKIYPSSSPLNVSLQSTSPDQPLNANSSQNSLSNFIDGRNRNKGRGKDKKDAYKTTSQPTQAQFNYTPTIKSQSSPTNKQPLTQSQTSILNLQSLSQSASIQQSPSQTALDSSQTISLDSSSPQEFTQNTTDDKDIDVRGRDEEEKQNQQKKSPSRERRSQEGKEDDSHQQQHIHILNNLPQQKE
ncbi:MAG: hypothetical protein EZS28_015118 [Streblomastix strix]|uniref:MIF4G domain-containing protein n=1 Tax=Streblomastix strix TaxID=222440 RepID=A0A5J4W3J2_9EUKA|nr:MAG: hypothetical protein EZS28_015118 [Streblomastix strix]